MFSKIHFFTAVAIVFAMVFSMSSCSSKKHAKTPTTQSSVSTEKSLSYPMSIVRDTQKISAMTPPISSSEKQQPKKGGLGLLGKALLTLLFGIAMYAILRLPQTNKFKEKIAVIISIIKETIFDDLIKEVKRMGGKKEKTLTRQRKNVVSRNNARKPADPMHDEQSEKFEPAFEPAGISPEEHKELLAVVGLNDPDTLETVATTPQNEESAQNFEQNTPHQNTGEDSMETQTMTLEAHYREHFVEERIDGPADELSFDEYLQQNYRHKSQKPQQPSLYPQQQPQQTQQFQQPEIIMSQEYGLPELNFMNPVRDPEIDRTIHEVETNQERSESKGFHNDIIPPWNEFNDLVERINYERTVLFPAVHENLNAKDVILERMATQNRKALRMMGGAITQNPGQNPAKAINRVSENLLCN